jgi:hypothetical protein
MNRTIIPIVLLCSILTMPGFAHNAALATAPSQYLVTLHILSVSTSGADSFILQSSQAEISSIDAENSAALFTDIKKIKVGEHFIELGANGELLWDGSIKQPGKCPFQLIGSPRILALEGQRTALIQADPVEYFEKSGDAYLLRTTPPDASPAISIDFAAKSTGNDQVHLDSRLILSVMTGRKKLGSTNLDVGEPILKKKEMPFNLETKLGKWLIPILLVTGKDAADNQEHLIVLMMIRRYK